MYRTFKTLIILKKPPLILKIGCLKFQFQIILIITTSIFIKVLVLGNLKFTF